MKLKGRASILIVNYIGTYLQASASLDLKTFLFPLLIRVLCFDVYSENVHDTTQQL